MDFYDDCVFFFFCTNKKYTVNYELEKTAGIV